jgi:hypothetical protein
MAGGVMADTNIPGQIGPCAFGTLGRLVTVRCPGEFAPLMQRAGGQWEPGTRRWLIEQWRVGPLVRALRGSTDPLFRRAGIDLDQ